MVTVAPGWPAELLTQLSALVVAAANKEALSPASARLLTLRETGSTSSDVTSGIKAIHFDVGSSEHHQSGQNKQKA